MFRSSEAIFFRCRYLKSASLLTICVGEDRTARPPARYSGPLRSPNFQRWNRKCSFSNGQSSLASVSCMRPQACNNSIAPSYFGTYGRASFRCMLFVSRRLVVCSRQQQSSNEACCERVPLGDRGVLAAGRAMIGKSKDALFALHCLYTGPSAYVAGQTSCVESQHGSVWTDIATAEVNKSIVSTAAACLF